MKIAIGSDHAGYQLKNKICDYLKQLSYDVVDCGTQNAETSVDYPIYALDVANKVAANEVNCGILVCGTGIGMSIAANKVPKIRAALVWNQVTAELSREHNNANILCLGGRTTSVEDAISFVNIWLNSKFLEGRHARRIEEISEIEQSC